MCDIEYINELFEEAEMEEEGYTWGYYPQTPFWEDGYTERQDVHTAWAMNYMEECK